MSKLPSGPFGLIPEWVILAADPTALKVYAVLAAHYANGDRVCFPKQETIAEYSSLSASTVKRSIASLVAIGAVVSTRSVRGSKKGHNVYFLPLTRGQICPPVGKYGSNLTPTESKVGVTDGPSITRPIQEEPETTTGAGAPELALFQAEPEVTKSATNGEGLTVGQRANVLAAVHYERLGKFGNFKAWHPLIKKALENGYADGAVDAALAYIAEHNWTLTGEKLRNVLAGGPKRPTHSPAAAGVDTTELNKWGKPVFYPSGKKIVYTRSGMELQV